MTALLGRNALQLSQAFLVLFERRGQRLDPFVHLLECGPNARGQFHAVFAIETTREAMTDRIFVGRIASTAYPLLQFIVAFRFSS